MRRAVVVVVIVLLAVGPANFSAAWAGGCCGCQSACDPCGAVVIVESTSCGCGEVVAIDTKPSDCVPGASSGAAASSPAGSGAAAAEPIPAPRDESAAYETPAADAGAEQDDAAEADSILAHPPAVVADGQESLPDEPSAVETPPAAPSAEDPPAVDPLTVEQPAATLDRYSNAPIDAASEPAPAATLPDEPATPTYEFATPEESPSPDEPPATVDEPSTPVDEAAAPADDAGSVLQDVFGDDRDAGAVTAPPGKPETAPATPAEPPAEAAPAGTPDAEDLFEDFSRQAPAFGGTSPVVSLESRTWTDATGEHQCEATLVSINTDGVVLSLTTGETIRAPYRSLSVDDLQFVRGQIEMRRAAIAQVGETVATAESR